MLQKFVVHKSSELITINYAAIPKMQPTKFMISADISFPNFLGDRVYSSDENNINTVILQLQIEYLTYILSIAI